VLHVLRAEQVRTKSESKVSFAAEREEAVKQWKGADSSTQTWKEGLCHHEGLQTVR